MWSAIVRRWRIGVMFWNVNVHHLQTVQVAGISRLEVLRVCVRLGMLWLREAQSTAQTNSYVRLSREGPLLSGFRGGWLTPATVLGRVGYERISRSLGRSSRKWDTSAFAPRNVVGYAFKISALLRLLDCSIGCGSANALELCYSL